MHKKRFGLLVLPIVMVFAAGVAFGLKAPHNARDDFPFLSLSQKAFSRSCLWSCGEDIYKARAEPGEERISLQITSIQ